MSNFWTGKRVWITGASSGIGRGLAEYVGERGAAVGLMARRQDRLQALADELISRNITAVAARADVSDAGDCRRAAEILRATLGDCDILIASAGIYRQTRIDRMDVETERQQWATNYGGVVHMVAEVLPSMLQRGQGQIAAISSLAAAIGLPAAAGYCASKAAVVRYMESLRLELRPAGVRATTILPGHVDTPMITEAERDQAVPLDKAVRKIARAIERGKAEYAFPKSTWFSIVLARLLPTRVRDAMVLRLESMPEVE